MELSTERSWSSPSASVSPTNPDGVLNKDSNAAILLTALSASSCSLSASSSALVS